MEMLHHDGQVRDWFLRLYVSVLQIGLSHLLETTKFPSFWINSFSLHSWSMLLALQMVLLSIPRRESPSRSKYRKSTSLFIVPVVHKIYFAEVSSRLPFCLKRIWYFPFDDWRWFPFLNIASWTHLLFLQFSEIIY